MFPIIDRLQVNIRIFHNSTGFVPGILEDRKRGNDNNYNLCHYPWTSVVIEHLTAMLSPVAETYNTKPF